MSEKNLQAKCLKRARLNGWLTYKFASPARRGVPDVIMVRQGEVVFVEFKNPNGKGKLSKLQEVEIAKLAAEDMFVYIVSSEEMFDAILQRFEP